MLAILGVRSCPTILCFPYFFCIALSFSCRFLDPQRALHWVLPLLQMSVCVSMSMQTKQGKRLGWARRVHVRWASLNVPKFYFAVCQTQLVAIWSWVLRELGSSRRIVRYRFRRQGPKWEDYTRWQTREARRLRFDRQHRWRICLLLREWHVHSYRKTSWLWHHGGKWASQRSTCETRASGRSH